MNDGKRCQEHDLDLLYADGDVVYGRRDGVVVGLRVVGSPDDMAEYLSEALTAIGAPVRRDRQRDWETCAAACARAGGGHRPGARYRAASATSLDCAHPELELRGIGDCWAIACTRCQKRWCIADLDERALQAHRDLPTLDE